MRPISLYVHVPFCRRACPYCTFYHVPYDRELEEKFLSKALEELESFFSSPRFGLEQGRAALRTLYVGGGSPSLLGEDSLARLMRGVERLFRTDGCVERSVEANPEDVTPEWAGMLKRSGFTRVSLGVQSMSERAQRTLGRCPPETNRKALSVLRGSFDNLNVDLLLGIPRGSVDEVEESLRSVLAFSVEHISLYCLEGDGAGRSCEEAFFARVDEERAAKEYLRCSSMLAGAGYVHYEVSNFALPGFACAHNLVYWRRGEYIGLGPSAASFLGGARMRNAHSLDVYLEASGDFSTARTFEILGEKERLLEDLLLALRTSDGIELEHLPEEGSFRSELEGMGLAVVEGGRLRLTDEGFLVLDEILLRLSG